MNTTAAVRIIACTSPTELYRHYKSETEAQPAYIELDLRHGTLLADWDAETGNGKPATVVYGLERRYSIPVLTGDAANRVMEEIRPMAERVLADWEEEWDGNNTIARLGEDAQAAEAEILAHLGLDPDGWSDGRDNQGFDESDLVAQWDIDGAVNGYEAEEYGITAETSDERLDEIEREILAGLAGCGTSPVAVCHELADHLQKLRDDLATEAAEDED